MPIYTTEAELLTFGLNPGAGCRINRWLSIFLVVKYQDP